MNFFYKYRVQLIVLVKSLIIVSAFLLAFLVRFDLSLPPTYRTQILLLVPPLLAIKLLVFWKIGLFKGWWRYVSMPDLMQILAGNLLASLLFISYVVIVHRLGQVPRSVLILDGVFCFLLMGGVRFATRAFRESFLPRMNGHNGDQQKRRVLVVGAGEAGQMIVREVRSNPRLNMTIVGFVDDDPLKRNGVFQGLQVLGRQADIEGVVAIHDVEEIIIAIPSASGTQVRTIVDKCRQARVKFKILPGVGDLIDGRVSIQEIRNVDLEDLLGRQPINLDQAQICNYLQGKRVLVTGAGGSIGSELCRQIVRFRPEKLVLFDSAETPLFLIEQELSIICPDIRIVPVIGDIRNPARVNVIFDQQAPQVVFHAAAYKHVPMMESNPAEAINNNIRGTCTLADAADKLGVETFVMISTDKAVRPTNIMGASKRAAETYVQALAPVSKTRFVTTRFGNVLGSNGSVIPTFKEQIKNGGPVTVTHPDVTRFFMTIPEAAQLVLQAGSMGRGGEIYLFDMGAPVKIVALAEELIRLSGLLPYEDIAIVYTGLRPGEKLYEELLLDDEGVVPTHHQKICVARSMSPDREVLIEKLDRLFDAAKMLDVLAIRSGLQEIVPEYQPVEHKHQAKIIQHPANVVRS
ncbi:MAG: nucleoside-diphosphate sugar epimerase/dehydratase, partial [Desulfuromonadales bacterium]|nr:nucleoside-diphosphate sugar epimerase/dehydratase [Desulfuromonadales bacterium]